MPASLSRADLARARLILRARALEAKQQRFQRVELYPKQAAIVDDPHRFTVTEATTKAGKTMSHIEWLLEEASKLGRGNWWWVATVSGTAAMAYRRAQHRLRGYIDSSGRLVRVADPIPFRKHDTEHWIDVFGARLWFKSAEKPDNLYGEDVYGAVGDEVSRWREDAWHALYSTLTATRGRAKLIGNVKGRQNWAYRIARKAEAGESDWGYHKLTALDAIEGGVIAHDTVEQAKRDLPENVFRELYMAEPSDDGGNPFGIAAIEACATDALSNDAPVVWGWDLAKSVDWTVGIALDKQGRVCRFERFQKVPWKEIVDRIVAATGNVPALVDSTGVGDPVLEALQRPVAEVGTGSPRLQPVAQRTNYEGFKFTPTSKQQLMEGLAVAIQQGQIAFPEGPIVNELESFEFEHTRTGVRYSAAEGLFDDCVCALALAWSKLMQKGRSMATASLPPGSIGGPTRIPSWRIE